MWFYYCVFFLLIGFYFLGQNKINKKLLFGISGLILVLIAAFRSPNVDRDYLSYVSYLKTIDTLNFIQLEPTFFVIANFSFLTFNPTIVFFFIYALIGISLKMKAILDLTEFWFLSLIIYFSYYFLIHDMTQVRVGIASAVLLLSVPDIYNRKAVNFAIKILIGSLFHYSFLIFSVFYLINPKKIYPIFYYLLILVAYLLYFIGFNPIFIFEIIPLEFIRSKVETYRFLMERDINTDINVLNILMIFRLIYMFLLIWNIKLLQTSNKYSIVLTKIFCWGLFSLVFLASMPVMAFRVNQLLCIVEIILWPFIIYLIKEKPLAVIFVIVTGFLMISVELFYNHLLNSYSF